MQADEESRIEIDRLLAIIRYLDLNTTKGPTDQFLLRKKSHVSISSSFAVIKSIKEADQG